MDIRFEFSVFFYVFQHRSKLFFDFFRKCHFLTLESLKTVCFWCFEGLGLCSNIFYSEKLQISYIKAEKDTRKHICWYFEGQKVVPQGPFGETKLYFEPEKRPPGSQFRPLELAFGSPRALLGTWWAECGDIFMHFGVDFCALFTYFRTSVYFGVMQIII